MHWRGLRRNEIEVVHEEQFRQLDDEIALSTEARNFRRDSTGEYTSPLVHHSLITPSHDRESRYPRNQATFGLRLHSRPLAPDCERWRAYGQPDPRDARAFTTG